MPQAETPAPLARELAAAVRSKGSRSGIEGLMREYDLSSQEGVALMCLAEALLRIPDSATRDALIRDKIGTGDWHAHVGHSPSLFVNAATWGLVVTGRLTAAGETGLTAALTRLIGRGGEPLIRRGVDFAMRLLGEQFVAGETIAAALANSRRTEARGYRHSYDMLGEAAMTAADAARYHRDYEQAIHAIGAAAKTRGLHDGPGISVKLSALHPRYTRTQRHRVMTELLASLQSLARLARHYDIGFNIDAEEADRLDLSLDLLQALCRDPDLAGWDGIGLAVQAYQKRAPFVLDFLIALARRNRRRLMLRLVKGAYWDSEIKHAQVDGLEDFPVFTRKIHTDISYLACARKLLSAPDVVFPQFATHNAHTVAAILGMAGDDFHPGQYEFQCLHGMGEPLYDEIVGPAKLNRPCRIYAPVGTHETLLAYLVRRLLENGANSSFVNRINDPAVPLDDLAADPVQRAAAIRPPGAPHPAIALPRHLFGPSRDNSTGLDFSNEEQLESLAAALRATATRTWRAGTGKTRPVRNPADRRDRVGTVTFTTKAQLTAAIASATRAAARWRAAPPAERAACLFRAADLLESRRPELLGLIVREAGKSLPNAVGEVREAVDFLRYYAAETRDHFHNDTHHPLGPVACISPWNFPLSIFTGQVAAALAAGNPVLAKPAEETPLIAAQAVAILHESGIPKSALHFLPGDGKTGAALVADRRMQGVVFTGSTDVAHHIQRQLANRLTRHGTPVPLIAETGGQNAMIVDSSALPEQVVADVLASAFDSAGQRCSALRVLCVQEDIADRVLAMLKGAMAELAIGNPLHLATDVGPVITTSAAETITRHIAAMRSAGHAVHAVPLPPACRHGSFVAPTLIEIPEVATLAHEVFGPVLHVLRFPRSGLDRLLADLATTGYALTFGLHSRIDDTIAHVTALAPAGNIYVNRTIIGAVVGVQPFGGHGLSGTGPKAGGPLYLRRLLSRCPPLAGFPIATEIPLPGPVGERNVYTLTPRGTALCIATDESALLRQISTALATGNVALISASLPLANAPPDLAASITTTDSIETATFDAVLFDGDARTLQTLCKQLAAREGPIIPVITRSGENYPLDGLFTERGISVNTSASGGNAALMALE